MASRRHADAELNIAADEDAADAFSQDIDAIDTPRCRYFAAADASWRHFERHTPLADYYSADTISLPQFQRLIDIDAAIIRHYAYFASQPMLTRLRAFA